MPTTHVHNQSGPCPWPQWWAQRWACVSSLASEAGFWEDWNYWKRDSMLCLMGSCEPGLLERLLEPLMLLLTQRSRLTHGLVH